jgi:hypothetical protein
MPLAVALLAETEALTPGNQNAPGELDVTPENAPVVGLTV